MNEHHIQIANEQSRLSCDEDELRDLVAAVISQEADVTGFDVSLAIAGEELTREVNSEFLDRTGTTDVISFTYRLDETRLEGEVIVNADEAIRRADETRHGPWQELLLYVVHGVLHLLGYEDSTPELRQRMNERAVELLRARDYELDSRTLLEDH